VADPRGPIQLYAPHSGHGIHSFDFRWGSARDPAEGAYSAPPVSLAVFKGPTSKGREGKGRGREGGRKGKGG